MRHAKFSYRLLVLSAWVLSSFAHAQAPRSGGEAQKFMQQYQQLAAEKTAMQAQIADLKKQLDASTAELAAAKKERDALKASAGGSVGALARATKEKQSAEQSLEQYKQRLNELVSRFRETAQNLKETEVDRTQLRKDLAERNSAYDQCASNNVQLFEISNEVLDRYEHVGLFTKASASEPFTRITRTRIENLADQYRARANELRSKERTP